MKNTNQFKFIPCYLIVVWLSTSIVFGQTKFTQKFGTIEDYKRLYYLNLQYTQSWAKSDTATYNSLLWAEDFVHQSSSDGMLYTKKKLMPVFGKPRFNEIEYFYPENVTIQFITPEAAMVFARPPFRGVGQLTESETQYNDVYVKRNGKWICVSANIAPVVKPEDKPASFTKLPEPTQFISYHPGSDNDRTVLQELNTKHAEAFLRSKVELVENILADDFILLSSNGHLFKKQEVLEQIRNSAKNNSVENYSVENLSIRFVSKDIAMIHAALVTKLKDGRSTAVQYNDVYVNREGKWICVSGNNTAIRN